MHKKLQHKNGNIYVKDKTAHVGHEKEFRNNNKVHEMQGTRVRRAYTTM